MMATLADIFEKKVDRWLKSICAIGELLQSSGSRINQLMSYDKYPLKCDNDVVEIGSDGFRILLEFKKNEERYMASLMPLQRNISPHKGAPSIRPFDTEEFVRSLEQAGPQLTSGVKGDWIGLYKKFFRSESFAGWYHQRQQEVNEKLQALHVEALCDADLMQWIRGKQEVEIVDLILRLREKMKYAADHQIPVTRDKLDQLQLHLDSIISTLPDDLKLVLNSN